MCNPSDLHSPHTLTAATATMALSPMDRKIALMRRETTMSDIARRLGVSAQHVSRVVAGERHSPTVEAAIAEELGLPVEAVFARESVEHVA